MNGASIVTYSVEIESQRLRNYSSEPYDYH